MPDPDTREKVAALIRGRCPLATVLTSKKPCPYFGVGGNCATCSYDWILLADEVLKVAQIRRASYERERGKAKELVGRVEQLEESYRCLVESDRLNKLKAREGVEAFAKLIGLADIRQWEEQDTGGEEGEDDDASDNESENKAGP